MTLEFPSSRTENSYFETASYDMKTTSTLECWTTFKKFVTAS